MKTALETSQNGQKGAGTTHTPYLHVTGICGVGTSPIAIAFHKKGWKVTGSDKGFYPPVSTHLSEAGISYYPGWHPENIAAAGRPDFIMAGGVGTASSNPELIYAKEQNIPVYAFAQVLQKYFIKKNSIVVVGTWGKTTSSSLLSYILLRAGMDPSYFTGGISLSHDTGALGDGDWSVVEGDEYQTAIWDKKPKFAYYDPTHLLLTSVSWDHADLYPTEQAYFDTFRDLVRKVLDKKDANGSSGHIVACIDDAGVRETLKKVGAAKDDRIANLITYGKSTEAEYYYHSVEVSTSGISFSIDHTKGNDKKTYKISSPMLGRFNVENMAGCFAMAHSIGISPEQIIGAIADFKGIKRRLEKRHDGGSAGITVFDCHAPTPEKAMSVLESLREVYKNKIIAIFEPNIGGRQRSSLHMYDNTLKDADTIIIPRLTKLKVDSKIDSKASVSDTSSLALEGPELTEAISKTHSDTTYIEDDETIVSKAIDAAKAGDIIVFLGSHGFRGMIESVCEKVAAK